MGWRMRMVGVSGFVTSSDVMTGLMLLMVRMGCIDWIAGFGVMEMYIDITTIISVFLLRRLSPKQGACTYNMQDSISSKSLHHLHYHQHPQSSSCCTKRPSQARQRNRERQIEDYCQTHQDLFFA
ncbi:hypothetical protein EDB19DRAFT_1731662 [Suillus lakei]|nr:hypothetical protein EDB19DRAFT_1731662 [Suillus lakei]